MSDFNNLKKLINEAKKSSDKGVCNLGDYIIHDMALTSSLSDMTQRAKLSDDDYYNEEHIVSAMNRKEQTVSEIKSLIDIALDNRDFAWAKTLRNRLQRKQKQIGEIA